MRLIARPPPAPAADQALQADVGDNLAARKAAYRAMSQTLNDECFLVWLPTLRMKIPVSSLFGNIHPSPMPHRILWNGDRIFLKHPRKAS